MKLRRLELLSPASNADIAIQAIEHGADAVYMGATSHGARKNAANSLDEIGRVVDFAHQFRSKVYITVNTIVYENEIRQVENLCRDLYHLGVDALIVQDMALLRMSLPPIALHASTQCDIRTPEKALFLQEVGFSQLVLARELTIPEIKSIAETVTIPVECFVHGALCVSYSGRCHASFALTGRSGNRGECAQICRLPFTLTDGKGKVIAKDKYLLSLKDFNASASLEDLIEAGVSSYKIEGRLKESGYVKNITSYYSHKLNQIINQSNGKFSRSSFGEVIYNFIPNPEKSFNRGFTDYFLTSRKPLNIASLDTPKSLGERINNISSLNNGDGISFFDKGGNFTGVNINRVEKGRLISSRKVEIPKNSPIFRTSDIVWNKLMAGKTAERKLRLEINIDKNGVTAEDERGLRVRLPLNFEIETSSKKVDYREIFDKLGSTVYKLDKYCSALAPNCFIRFSELTSLRRKLIEELNRCNRTTYPFDYRREENLLVKYSSPILYYGDNVANSLAESFYKDHGVVSIEKAAEVSGFNKKEEAVLMTTRHCILRELGLCKKNIKNCNNRKIQGDMVLINGNKKLKLSFDCENCEMKIIN